MSARFPSPPQELEEQSERERRSLEEQKTRLTQQLEELRQELSAKMAAAHQQVQPRARSQDGFHRHAEAGSGAGLSVAERVTGTGTGRSPLVVVDAGLDGLLGPPYSSFFLLVVVKPPFRRKSRNSEGSDLNVEQEPPSVTRTFSSSCALEDESSF